MTEKRLILFDIDGTLIASGGIWGRCFFKAVQELFPDVEIPANVSFAGKTDLQVCQEIFEYSGIPLEKMDETISHIIDSYIKKAKRSAIEKAAQVKIFPGITQILPQLQQMPNVALSLLTGNIKTGAEIKLSCKNLSSFFDFDIGAWGGDNSDRYQLPSIAVARAQKKLGISFVEKEIVIIGDTIHDINCGKSIGVRTIAVGTGKVPRQELEAENPDFYFDTLENVPDVLSAIFSKV